MQPPDESGSTDSGHRVDPFVELARAVSGTDGPRHLPQRLCHTFVSLLNVDGGAITLAAERSERTTVCATDDVAERLADLEEVYGEGPGADAFTGGTVVTGALDAATPTPGAPGQSSDRWPLFTNAAHAAVGPLFLHAFPMRTTRSVLGVATVYQRRVAPLAVEIEHAQLLADAIGVALARPSDSLQSSPWPARDRINQAIGMVVARLGVAPDDALALLRAFAFSHDLSLDEAAAMVVERRYVFDLGDHSGDETR